MEKPRKRTAAGKAGTHPPEVPGARPGLWLHMWGQTRSSPSPAGAGGPLGEQGVRVTAKAEHAGS